VTSAEDTPGTRWYLRVLPVCGLLVVVAAAALVIPSFRHQAELSLTRQPDPYVELYFARSVADGGQAVCTRSGATVQVSFVMVSHLERRQAVAWQAVLDPSGRTRRAARQQGSVRTAPGQATGMRASFSLPGKLGYTVSVTLPALEQQVRAHCPGRST
jgi:hypothetical protein